MGGELRLYLIYRGWGCGWGARAAADRTARQIGCVRNAITSAARTRVAGTKVWRGLQATVIIQTLGLPDRETKMIVFGEVYHEASIVEIHDTLVVLGTMS